MGTYIEPLNDMEQALIVLGHREALESARASFAYRFGWPIYRWERRAYQLGQRSIENNKLTYEGESKDYDLHKYLTIADIRFLADFEPLDPSVVEQVITEHTRLTLPTALTSVSLSSGTTFLEFALFFCTLYFWLFQREGRLSPAFPGSGTLFAVFSRTRLSRLLFLFLMSIPAWSAVLLAYWSMEFGRTLNSVLSVLTLMVAGGIARQSPTAYLVRRRSAEEVTRRLWKLRLVYSFRD